MRQNLPTQKELGKKERKMKDKKAFKTIKARKKMMEFYDFSFNEGLLKEEQKQTKNGDWVTKYVFDGFMIIARENLFSDTLTYRLID